MGSTLAEACPTDGAAVFGSHQVLWWFSLGPQRAGLYTQRAVAEPPTTPGSVRSWMTSQGRATRSSFPLTLCEDINLSEWRVGEPGKRLHCEPVS